MEKHLTDATSCPKYEKENPSVIAALLARVSLLEKQIAAVGREDADKDTIQSGPFTLLGFSFGGIGLRPSAMPKGRCLDDSKGGALSACLAPLPGTCNILLFGPTDLKLSRVKVSIGSTVRKDFKDLSFSSGISTTDGMGEVLLPSICRLDEGWERNTDTCTIRICIEEIAHTLSYGPGVATSACLNKQRDNDGTIPRTVEWHIEQADKVLSGTSRIINSPEFSLPGAKGDTFCLRLVLPEADRSEQQATCGLYLARCHSPNLTRQHELQICADLSLSATRPSQEIRKELKGELTHSLGFDQFCSVSSAFARLSSQRELAFLLALKHVSVVTTHGSFFGREETEGRLYLNSCGLSERVFEGFRSMFACLYISGLSKLTVTQHTGTENNYGD
ncbi:hypothetical protein FOL47_009201 [Perkinsus chesapeaki]|uniref:Uncharacterized protein n=1 Tax=Perkinsus chesapeaki TaxID=330153 RepID=A0A7J6L9T7_PERCH|nr:hypothetical protein FOL47_009201 [Perkinsus chesapeaki]